MQSVRAIQCLRQVEGGFQLAVLTVSTESYPTSKLHIRRSRRAARAVSFGNWSAAPLRCRSDHLITHDNANHVCVLHPRRGLRASRACLTPCVKPHLSDNAEESGRICV